jgi:hypothetical protein
MSDMESASRKKDSSSTITHVYDINGFKGFAGEFDDAFLKTLKSRESVVEVEPDRMMKLNKVQRDPSNWGLARIGTKEKRVDFSKYEYPDSAGYVFVSEND